DAAVELDPVHLSGKRAAAVRSVVVRHRRSGFVPEIERLFAEGERFGLPDACFAALLPVDKERVLATLAYAAAVVRELEPNLMLAGWHGASALDVRLLESEKVVTPLRLAVLGVQAPATGVTPHRDHDTFSARLRNLDFGGNGERLVRHIDHRQR